MGEIMSKNVELLTNIFKTSRPASCLPTRCTPYPPCLPCNPFSTCFPSEEKESDSNKKEELAPVSSNQLKMR